MANNDFIISTLNIQSVLSAVAKSKSKIIPGINTITWISPVFHL